MKQNPKLSVVIPIYNELDILEVSLIEFRKVLDQLDYTYEVLAVNDGSTDGSTEVLRNWQSKWNQLRVLELLANRGHMAAITAGLENASGEWVITIDVDLQDPPAVIPRMLDMAISDDLHVVYGVREDRTSDSWFKRNSAFLYYKILSKALNMHVPMNAADCRLMSRAVVEALNTLPEKQKVYRLLVPYLGFSFGEYKYVRSERQAGKTHYSTGQMVNLALNSITTFSTKPLRMSTWTGLAGLFVFVFGLVYVAYGYSQGNTSPGWASIVLAVLLVGALQLLSLGILGRYIANMYVELQNRPIYNLKEDKSE